MDDLELIRTISATANKGKQDPDATRRCLNILKERDEKRDEELVKVLVKTFWDSDPYTGDDWRDLNDLQIKEYERQARRVIKVAREGKK